MRVALDDRGVPVAWGEKVVGEDIPVPPDALVNNPTKRPMWDSDAEQWIEDLDFEPGPQTFEERVREVLRDEGLL